MTTTAIDERVVSHEHIGRLREAILTHSARITIMGMGYVGLPMAIEFAEAGFFVVGIDSDIKRCEALAKGHSHVASLPDERVANMVSCGRLQITSHTEVLADADVVLICVPTPLRKTKDPDMTAIMDATRAVAEHVHPGQIIVLESTTYPGTTEEVLLPMFKAKGYTPGVDFCLAFSPERIDPGNRDYDVSNITKLVGACSPLGTQIAALLYEQIVTNVVQVSNTRVAEAAKLLENTFRSVNIALANEMAIICRHLGVDVWEVIDAAATKPFGFMPHYPGPGIGGHCIPLDPHYLAWKARLSGYEPMFIRLASKVNGDMPAYIVDMVTLALNDLGKPVKNSRILVMGVSYKPNVADIRESPALEVMERLEGRGANLVYSDPFVPTLAFGESMLQSHPLSAELVRESACVVVVTNHTAFDYEMVAREAAMVVDTRNAMRPYAPQNNIRFL